MGLLMSRGEHWKKGYMFCVAESMPLSKADCNAEDAGVVSKISCSPDCE